MPFSRRGPSEEYPSAFQCKSHIPAEQRAFQGGPAILQLTFTRQLRFTEVRHNPVSELRKSPENSTGVQKIPPQWNPPLLGMCVFWAGLAMYVGYAGGAAARANAQVLGPLWRASHCALTPHGDIRGRHDGHAAAPGAGLAVTHEMTLPAIHREHSPVQDCWNQQAECWFQHPDC